MAVDIKLTGRENVLLFARLYGIANPKETTDEVLAIMELSDRADDLIRTYSGGMRHRWSSHRRSCTNRTSFSWMNPPSGSM